MQRKKDPWPNRSLEMSVEAFMGRVICRYRKPGLRAQGCLGTKKGVDALQSFTGRNGSHQTTHLTSLWNLCRSVDPGHTEQLRPSKELKDLQKDSCKDSEEFDYPIYFQSRPKDKLENTLSLRQSTKGV